MITSKQCFLPIRLKEKESDWVLQVAVTAPCASNFSTVSALCAQVATSQLLKRVFATVLATGNALNAGTSHGDADGFRLETLQKLGGVKVCILLHGHSAVLDFAKRTAGR